MDDAISAEMQLAQRNELMGLQQDEARFKNYFTNVLAGESSQVESIIGRAHGRTASFLQGKQTPGIVEATGALASDAQREIKQVDYLMSALKSYRAAVDVGGYTARKALIALTSLMSEPNAKLAAAAYIPLLRSLKNLMKRESTPDQLRTAAGSIITQITGMPVAVSSSDAQSGSYGHVNIVVPSPSRVYGADAGTLALKAGAAPEGAYYPTSFLAQKNRGPIIDFPRELIADVNKAPFPTVNVIADADEDPEAAATLAAARRASAAFA